MFTTVEPPHATIAPPTSRALLSLKVPPSIVTDDPSPSQYTCVVKWKESVNTGREQGGNERTFPRYLFVKSYSTSYILDGSKAERSQQ